MPPPSPRRPSILQESLFSRNKKDPSDKEGADEGDEDGRGGFEDEDEEKKKIRLDEEESKLPLTQDEDAMPDRGVVKQAISEPEIRTRCDEELTSNDPHLMGYKRMTVAGEYLCLLFFSLYVSISISLSLILFLFFHFVYLRFIPFSSFLFGEGPSKGDNRRK